jgi:hypothetical protein
MVGIRVHPQPLRVDQALAGVQAKNFADQELAMRAEGERHGFPTFERKRRLRDPRRGHIDARKKAQPCGVDFALVRREIDRADVHCLRQRLVDEVDDEDAAAGDVPCRVLGGSGRLVLEAEHDERRVLREHVEEAERRRIHDAGVVDARDQRDGARDHGRDQELVALVRLEIGEDGGEGHGVFFLPLAGKGSYFGGGSTPTCAVMRP